MAGLASALFGGAAEGRRRGKDRGGTDSRDRIRGDDRQVTAEKKKKKRCKVKCGGKTCGPSNCRGKTCGTCIPPTQCNAQGQCVGCTQGSHCVSGVCCNQLCCADGQICNGQGKCVDCLTSDDCDDGQVCTEAQHCCTPNCDGRRCGPDGCGETCACPDGATCNENGRCVCDQPDHVVCNGACIEAECCADGVLPGVLCGDRCQPQPSPGLNCCVVWWRVQLPTSNAAVTTAQGTVCLRGTCCQPIGGSLHAPSPHVAKGSASREPVRRAKREGAAPTAKQVARKESNAAARPASARTPAAPTTRPAVRRGRSAAAARASPATSVARTARPAPAPPIVPTASKESVSNVGLLLPRYASSGHAPRDSASASTGPVTTHRGMKASSACCRTVKTASAATASALDAATATRPPARFRAPAHSRPATENSVEQPTHRTATTRMGPVAPMARAAMATAATTPAAMANAARRTRTG